MSQAVDQFVRQDEQRLLETPFAFHHRTPATLTWCGLPNDGLNSPKGEFELANSRLSIRTAADFRQKYGQTDSIAE